MVLTFTTRVARVYPRAATVWREPEQGRPGRGYGFPLSYLKQEDEDAAGLSAGDLVEVTVAPGDHDVVIRARVLERATVAGWHDTTRLKEVAP